MRIALAIIIALSLGTVAGCGDDAPKLPASQQALYDEAAKLASALDAANDSDNSVQRRAVSAEIDKYQATPRTAVAWRGTVDSVTDLTEDLTIDVDQPPATFHLVIVDPAMKSWAAGLKHGDVLFFDGDVGTERSFSDSGATDNPEFRFWPSAIVDAAGARHTQDAQTIVAARAAEKQSQFDSLASATVSVACEKAIRKLLDLPYQANFSRLHARVWQLSPGHWGYKNRVDIKNRFGATLTRDAGCTADVTRGADGAPAIANIEAAIL